MYCKAIIFIIAIMLFSSGAYAAADVQKMQHNSVSNMLRDATTNMLKNPGQSLVLIATWQSPPDTIIKIEEAAQMRRIIFYATRLLFKTKKLSSANLEDSSFCNSSVVYSAHHRNMCTIIKNRLEAFERKPLAIFKQSIAAIPKEIFINSSISSPPDLYLAKLLHENQDNPLSSEQWQIVYFHLFSLAGVHDVGYVYEHYKNVIDVLQENFDQFDDSLERPATEGGFFTNNKVRIINNIGSRPLNSIVFGGGLNATTYFPSAYLVNIMSTTEYLQELRDNGLSANMIQQRANASSVDMVADMNNSEQLQNIPDKFFERVYAEHIPIQDYFNPHFFKNAARILKDDGELIIDSYTITKAFTPPYNIVKDAKDIAGFADYFAKNGFIMVQPHSVECNYPSGTGRKGDKCFIFKKFIKEKAAEGKVERAEQAEN